MGHVGEWGGSCRGVGVCHVRGGVCHVGGGVGHVGVGWVM